MVEQTRLLQAQIEADLVTIADTYQKIEALGAKATGSQQDIVLGYYLHVLYGLFENIFVQIASSFGNHIEEQAQWHTHLLRRMTLDVKAIRPAVISVETHQYLNELRGFRHLFRNAYLLEFDAVRLNIVLDSAMALKPLYQADLAAFLNFLDDAAQSDNRTT